MQASACEAKASFSSMTSRSRGGNAGAGEGLAAGGDRADAHDVRRAAGDRDGFDARQHRDVVAACVVLGADQHGGGAVGQRRGGAGGDGAGLVEGGFQPGEPLGGGLGADAFILRDHGFAVGDGHDLGGEAAFGAGGCGLALAGKGEFLLRGAA